MLPLFVVIQSCMALKILDPEWLSFTATYGRTLKNAYEERIRYDIFKRVSRQVAEHNALYKAGKSHYTLAINQFADWTAAERSMLTMGMPILPRLSASTENFYFSTGIQLPQSINWTQLGCVSPVKFQAMCGSCWAFSTTGSLEGVTCAKTGVLVELSEQQLVDCCGTLEPDMCWGCEGGFPSGAFLYIRDAGGIMTERDYPYQGTALNCHFDKKKAIEFDTGFKRILAGDEEGLAEALVRFGPISICVRITEAFGWYKNGIFDDPNCDNSTTGEVDHAILLVGFGVSEHRVPYWIIKNSWSTEWGENGYMRIRRGNNTCLVANLATFPTLA